MPLIPFAVAVWIGALMLISIIVLPVPGVFLTAGDGNAVVIETLALLNQKIFCRAEVARRPSIASGILINPGRHHPQALPVEPWTRTGSPAIRWIHYGFKPFFRLDN